MRLFVERLDVWRARWEAWVVLSDPWVGVVRGLGKLPEGAHPALASGPAGEVGVVAVRETGLGSNELLFYRLRLEDPERAGSEVGDAPGSGEGDGGAVRDLPDQAR